MTHIAVVCQDKGVPLDGTKGASIHLRSMATAFARNGVDVTVLSPRIGNARWDPESRIDTVQVDSAPPNSPDMAEVMSAALWDANAKKPIDAVYERLSLFAVGASRWAREVELPYSVEVNAPLAEEARSHRGLREFDVALRTEEEVLKCADSLYPVSPRLKRWLVDLGCDGDRIHVLPNGVHSEFLSHYPRPRWEAGPFRIGFVGSLKPWHDLETLIETLRILPKDEFELVIVGEGPKRKWLDNLTSQELGGRRLKLSEPVPHSEISRVIDEMDVCVAPYGEMEDFYFCPIKIFEYGARKRPVIAPDLPELREQFPDGSVLHYRPFDAMDLARRIIECRQNPDWADGFVNRLFEFVSGHTWEGHAQSVLERMDRTPVKKGGMA